MINLLINYFSRWDPLIYMFWKSANNFWFFEPLLLFLFCLFTFVSSFHQSLSFLICQMFKSKNLGTNVYFLWENRTLWHYMYTIHYMYKIKTISSQQLWCLDLNIHQESYPNLLPPTSYPPSTTQKHESCLYKT